MRTTRKRWRSTKAERRGSVSKAAHRLLTASLTKQSQAAAAYPTERGKGARRQDVEDDSRPTSTASWPGRTRRRESLRGASPGPGPRGRLAPKSGRLCTTAEPCRAGAGSSGQVCATRLSFCCPDCGVAVVGPSLPSASCPPLGPGRRCWLIAASYTPDSPKYNSDRIPSQRTRPRGNSQRRLVGRTADDLYS